MWGWRKVTDMRKSTIKYTITIVLLLLFCNVYGQKWHLNRINKNSKFKYEYWFNFDNLEDSSSYSFNKQKGQTMSSIHLTNNYADTVAFVIIAIRDLDNDTIFPIVTDMNGYGNLKLKSGKYKIEISDINYDKFSFEFTLLDNEYFNLNVCLGLASDLTVYQINSKNELSKKEISRIIECVKKNRNNFSHCRDLIRKKYSILMQI